MPEPNPDRIALIADDGGAAVTYRELEARSNQCAHYVRGLGMCGSDDVVAVLVDNDVHYYHLLVGVRRSGATFTALNYDLDPDSLSHILPVCRAKVLVATDTMADLAARIVKRHRRRRRIAWSWAHRIEFPSFRTDLSAMTE